MTDSLVAEAAATAFRDANLAAEGLARTWYSVPDGQPFPEVQGIDLGFVLLVDVYEQLLADAMRWAGVRRSQGRVALPTALKRRGLDRPVRTWGMRLRAGRRADAGSGPIAFLSDLPTPSALEPMLAVAKRLPAGSFTVGATDPRTLRAWRRAYADRTRPVLLPLRLEMQRARVANREVARAWRSWQASRPHFTFGSRDVTSDVLSTLRRVVCRSGMWAIPESEALASFVARVRPEVIVVASDQHRTGRMAVKIAAKAGLPVIVLQHGLPQDDLGYVPVVADLVAVWSEGSRAWFESRGTSPKRLAVLGNPRFDSLASAVGEARDSMARSLQLDGRPGILLPLSEAAPEVNLAVLTIALDSLTQTPGASLVVKLHPGMREWRYVKDAVSARSALRDRVRVLHREPLYPLLAWADLTFIHRSSVALESLAAGTPVVTAAVDGQSIGDLELVGFELPQAATGGSLAQIAQSLSARSARDQFIAARSKAIQEAAGPLDGQSAARIGQYLLDIAQKSQGEASSGPGFVARQ